MRNLRINTQQKTEPPFSLLLPGADVISFDGHGVISYRFRSKKMKIVKDVISLKFRTTAGDGILLHGEGQQGDYISLELLRARLQLSINLGKLVHVWHLQSGRIFRSKVMNIPKMFLFV